MRAVVLVATGALLAGVFVPLSAQAVTGDGYFQASYSPVIYQVSGGIATPVTYDQWVEAGRPTPTAATVTYAKYSWDPVIYRTTTFGSLVAEADHQETSAEWGAAGRPAPGTASAAGAHVYQWSTSAELFAQPADGVVHKLAFAQWSALGRPAPAVHANEGFEKLSWAPHIFTMSNVSAGYGTRLSDTGDWFLQGYPTPRVVDSLPGQRFLSHPGSPTITYLAGGQNIAFDLTYQEWVDAGRPTPSAT